METFGDRLKEALAESPLSKRAVARRIEASSHSRLDEWIAGQGSPSVDELLALAQALGVRVGWLAGGEAPKRPVPPLVEVEGFREVAAIVDRVRATPLTETGEVMAAAMRRAATDPGAIGEGGR